MFLLNVFSPQKWINNKNNQYVIIGKGIIDSYDNYNEKILKNDITVLKFD